MRRGAAAPPTPPPRDPAGINSIVQQHHRSSSSSNGARSSNNFYDPHHRSSSARSSRSNLLLYDPDDPEDNMSSDSSSPPRQINNKRRSSYENVDTEPTCPTGGGKPPSSMPRRTTTPSPRPHQQHHQPHFRSSPAPSLHSRHASPAGPRSQSADHWSCSEATLSDEGGGGESVRRRPASACRAPRTHRGSMPPVDCASGSAAWMHRGAPFAPPPCCAPSPYHHWCGGQNWPHHYQAHPTNDSIYESDDLSHKIFQLQTEKEQLTLQVNVLSEQVEAQNEKIAELENSLAQNKEQLINSEALLRQEMSSRSSIETIKLDLMTQISALRLRLTSVESEKHEIEEKNYKLENELILACASLAEKEADLSYLQSTFKSRTQGTTNDVNKSEGEYLEKLKEALKSVITANDEKERQIQELKLSLNRYKKLQELVFSNRKGDDIHKKTSSFDDSFHSTSSCVTPFNLEGIDELGFDFNLTEKPPPVPRLQHSLSTIPFSEDFHRSSSRIGDLSRQSPFSPIRGESPSPFSSLNVQRYNSSENVSPPTPQKTPPAKRHYSTLPRPHATDIIQQYIKSPMESPSNTLYSGQTSQSYHNLHHPNYEAFKPVPTKSSGASFGKGFFKLRSGKRSCSAPELVPDKCQDILECSSMEPNYRRTSSPLTTVAPKEKSKGLKKIFGKVKRTGSESLNHTEAELKRGGIRATAGPRLGWSNPSQNGIFKADKPFAEWDTLMICDWLHHLGLGMYMADCKKGIKSGDQLLKASTHGFEKDLGIKNSLHRKKLLLAVSGAKEQAGDIVEPAGKLDHHWVVRWLDDIGLPQYKDAFFDARVDGRMLHHLTLEDLSHLKVTNLLHHISIKTGIQVLRENNFDGQCLKRRSLPEDENTPSDVSRWTNHRVMEWLRTVDLSEYAPNLRGSGVHGGLMLYEPRFNADLMATLLNIPPNKTLLRRHLSTQFKSLVGAEIMQRKREWEAQPSYSPLSPSAKVKPVRKSHFSLMKKRNKNELAFEDYVCPLNFSEKIHGSTKLTNGHNTSEDEKFLMKEMVIKNEKILDSMPASNV